MADENDLDLRAKLSAKIHNEQLKLAGNVVTQFGVVMSVGAVGLVYAAYSKAIPEDPADWMWALGFAGLIVISVGVMLLLKMRSED